MPEKGYLMESDEEAVRLDRKTDREAVRRRALWAGIKPGMRAADLGCGSGTSTAILQELVQPGGEALGVDISPSRLAYAREHYGSSGAKFVEADIRAPLKDLGSFDFVWVSFFLEYFRKESFTIVRNMVQNLKPGGILCLIDLDYNCLTHFGLPARLEKAITELIGYLAEHADFDPYVGRKLYAYLCDLGFDEIDVRLSAHHLIFGEPRERDIFNWMKKIKIAASSGAELLASYEGGGEGFLRDIEAYFLDRRRFIYTPLIAVRGVKGAE